MSEESFEPHASVTIRACKYDGTLHRSWPARLLRRSGSLLVFDAAFTEEVNHALLGRIVPGTVSLEYYWTDRWYNIFRFSEPGGRLRNFYCNVNAPPSFDGQTLSYTDLDIDMLVAPDFTYSILDEDEFASNALLYGYPPDVIRHAREALAELVQMVLRRKFPFNESV